MTENASDPETQSPPEPPKRPRWPLIAGVIAIVLIVLGAIKGIGACPDRVRSRQLDWWVKEHRPRLE
jgi:hypothetical protein